MKKLFLAAILTLTATAVQADPEAMARCKTTPDVSLGELSKCVISETAASELLQLLITDDFYGPDAADLIRRCSAAQKVSLQTPVVNCIRNLADSASELYSVGGDDILNGSCLAPLKLPETRKAMLEKFDELKRELVGSDYRSHNYEFIYGYYGLHDCP